ncbi:MAG: UDP-glucose--hexose-1-phosphate uridylyltransferase [Clostridia bacterium]|nr:UDP-glucose--hexose-1-phosphate uridylyltransferase [Clostridia bacterium]
MTDILIKQFIQYALEKELIQPEDEVYTVNRVLDITGIASYSDPGKVSAAPLEEILGGLTDEAVKNGKIPADSIAYRDLLDTRLMGAVTPRPSEVIKKFRELYAASPEKATDWYYKFSRDTDYIRTYRVKKDLKWTVDTEYGRLDISINLSKPEKDPRAIAAARNKKDTAYPKCQLCRENEGYAGRLDHPARLNHRIIPITLDGGEWALQYSPYVYYNEHCIALNQKHIPMAIDRSAFRKLFDFVTAFPHYFIGSNADLPIVGGSILSHEHFQGGHYEFAMERAQIKKELTFRGFEDVKAGIVNWPMSIIRLNCADSDRLIDLSDKILNCWRGYTDEDSFIFAETDGEKHNTITPVVRRRGESFEIDLVLRNNITTEEHPLGVYHPHSELHHIKQENIGLIEVMGLAILPPRLLGDIERIKAVLISGKNAYEDETIASHADWIENFRKNYTQINEENAEDIIKKEIGLVFARVLEHAGVYKNEDAFMRFIDYVNR